jgi:hypothetical protein
MTCVGGSLAHPSVEDLARVSPGWPESGDIPTPGCNSGGLFLLAFHLADSRIDIDHQPLAARPRTQMPGSFHHRSNHGFELADMPEGAT